MARRKETEAEPATCGYCGAALGGENAAKECPACYRPGCEACLPGGRGVICPECEHGARGEAAHGRQA